ncbi:uncharacterized protein LOC123703833 [Colias croceus]|uniref:uncharacterized protein LOC123703833 n=1 Tax=Colias crocea TaxID=72248 RepID=UPI001E27B25A|nr:uncharacterized protein LOC123703833 [Colias croceus]
MFILNFILFVVLFKNITADEENAQKKIEDLEKEKNDLFFKINDAIDKNIESFKTLNETEAILAADYLKDLKEQLQELNKTDEVPDVENINISDTTVFRRKSKPKNKEDFVKHMEKILKPKHVSQKKLKEILETRDRVKIKLDEWLEERKREKDKIKKYKMEMKYLQRMGRIEKCPRLGYGTRKKSDKSDYVSCKKRYKSRYDKMCSPGTKDPNRPLKTRTKGRKLYPCCRKCCKKSYLGCL